MNQNVNCPNCGGLIKDDKRFCGFCGAKLIEQKNVWREKALKWEDYENRLEETKSDEYRIREGALQSITDYRDHFVHSFHVFVLGYHIFKMWKEDGITPLDFTQDDPNRYLKTWFVASIYHDVGYPAEKLEILVEDFFR